MASPITIGGVQVLAPSQGDTYLWGGPIQTALAQIAVTCLQTTGGSFPLTADLNLGSGFGLIAPYYKSALGANIAAAGILRLLNTDLINWRNLGNTGDNSLLMGQGVAGQPTDELCYTNKTRTLTRQITGNAFASYHQVTTQTGIATSATVINFDTSDVDADSAVTTGAGWKYTVPGNKDGLYLVSAVVPTTQVTNPGTQTLTLLMNGATIATSIGPGQIAAAGAYNHFVTGAAVIAAGQTIQVVLSTSAGTVSTNVASYLCRIMITKLVQ